MIAVLDLSEDELKMLRAILIVRKDRENGAIRMMMERAATQLDKQLYPNLPAYNDHQK